MEELDEKQKKKLKRIRIIISSIIMALFVAGMIFATIMLYPYFARITTDEVYRNEMVEKIEAFGGYSFLIIVSASVVQTVLAVIPGGPIVVVAGMLFNPFIAFLICVLGQTLGSIIVFLLVKLLGVKFVGLFFDPDKIKNSKLLENEIRVEVIMIGYLMIPAFPKDIVSFVAPFTKVKFRNFVLITLFARIPMTLVSVFMGNAFFTGDYTIAIILASISAILAFLCILFNKQITNFIDKIANRSKKNEIEEK